MAMGLTNRLEEDGVSFDIVSKSEKVRLLKRWGSAFQPLSLAARKGILSPGVLTEAKAEQLVLSAMPEGLVYVLPNDESSLPSVLCELSALNWMSEMTADSMRGCEEIVIIDQNFAWSCVLVNHGVAGVGRYATVATH